MPYSTVDLHDLPVEVSHVTAVDFDAKGRSDLLVGQNGHTMLYRSHPDGSFDVGVDFMDRETFVTFDLDRDGRTDIGWSEGDTLCVQLCGSDGQPGPVTRYDTGGGVLCQGDFNGDGWPDLFVLQWGGMTATMTNDGTGHFGTPVPTGVSLPLAYHGVAGDFDGDGFDDVAVTGVGSNSTPDTVWVLRREGGDNTFAIRAWVPRACNPCDLYPQQIFAMDLDRDGRLDLVVLRTYSNESGYYFSSFNRGDWDFAPAATAPYVWAEHPVSHGADLNLDGWPDLVAASTDYIDLDGRVQLHLNHGDGTLDTAVVMKLRHCPATDVTIGDFNGDRKPDLAVGYGYVPGYGVRDGFAILLNVTPDQPAIVPGAHMPVFAIEPVRPNPTRGPVVASITLGAATPAFVDLLDVGGRQVAGQRLASPAIGRNTVQLAPERVLAPGIYWVRLRQENRTATTRVAVIR